MMATMMVLSVSMIFVSASAPSCAEEEVPTTLAQFAHTSNQDFISRAMQRVRFVPEPLQPVVIDSSGALERVDAASTKFLTYDSDNGWNNQLLNLLCAMDMARTLNRTLVVPPYAWRR